MFHIDGRLAILATACQASTPHKTLRQERTAPGPPGAAGGLLARVGPVFASSSLNCAQKGSDCSATAFPLNFRVFRVFRGLKSLCSLVTLTQGGAVRRQIRNRL